MAWPAPPARSFVGRAAPLALLQRSLDEALTGTPRAVLVEGDAGIGKSRLAAELLDRARRRGAVVLVGRCSEDLNVPYLALATALDPLGGELGAAAQLLEPAVAAGRPLDPLAAIEAAHGGTTRGRLPRHVVAARRRPIVLLLEDLHWADPHTAELLEQLIATSFHAGTLASTAILFVVTLRPPEGHVARTVERLQRERAVQSVRLGGMSELELNELITSLAPARPSRGLLSEVTQATAGNPLLVRTMVARQLDVGGLVVRHGELVSTVDELVPGGLDSELRRRLDVVGRPCRAMLTTAAFLGDGALVADLESVVPADFDDLLAEAEVAGLLRDDGERYTFDHPLVRQLLYHEPGGRHRQRLHLSLADHLEARYGEDPRRAIEIADHLCRSGSHVDRSRLAAACLRASEQAFAVAAWGSAARYLDAALEADPPTDTLERARLALQSGIGHFRDHDLRAVEARLSEAIEGAKAVGDIDMWGVAALLLTRTRFTIGPDSIGVGTDTGPLEELLRTPGVDDRLTAQIVSMMAEIRFHAFDVDGGLTLLEQAAPARRQHGRRRAGDPCRARRGAAAPRSARPRRGGRGVPRIGVARPQAGRPVAARLGAGPAADRRGRARRAGGGRRARRRGRRAGHVDARLGRARPGVGPHDAGGDVPQRVRPSPSRRVTSPCRCTGAATTPSCRRSSTPRSPRHERHAATWTAPTPPSTTGRRSAGAGSPRTAC